MQVPAVPRSWDDLRYFVAVAAHGNLARAAEALEVSLSTALRRLNALEDELGAPLFDRAHDHYRLTEIGAQCLPLAQRVAEDVHALARRAMGAESRLEGTVRVTTVHEVLQLIGSELRCFRDEYPGIVLELNTEMRLLSLAHREADVAIRAGGEPREQEIIARPLCEIGYAAYAAPTYLAGVTRPRRPADLRRHSLVTFGGARHGRGAARWVEEHAAGAVVAARTDSVLGQLEAAAAGLGVAILPTMVGELDGRVERLFRVRGDWTDQLWLLLHRDLRQTARVRAFIDFITARLQGRAALIAGR